MRPLTLHHRCDNCGKPLIGARFGQRFCDRLCRLEGMAAEGRAARRAWDEAGRPMFCDEIEDEQGVQA